MQNKHFPFIYCIEALVHERKYLLWESCYEKLGLDPKPVTDCYESEAGKEVSFLVFLFISVGYLFLISKVQVVQMVFLKSCYSAI